MKAPRRGTHNSRVQRLCLNGLKSRDEVFHSRRHPIIHPFNFFIPMVYSPHLLPGLQH